MKIKKRKTDRIELCEQCGEKNCIKCIDRIIRLKNRLSILKKFQKYKNIMGKIKKKRCYNPTITKRPQKINRIEKNITPPKKINYHARILPTYGCK